MLPKYQCPECKAYFFTLTGWREHKHVCIGYNPNIGLSLRYGKWRETHVLHTKRDTQREI